MVPVSNLPALRRDSSRRVVGGVCAGLARSFNVDPILIRAALVVACVASMGMALLAYVALWLLIPSDRVARPRAWRPARTLIGVAVLVLILNLILPDHTGTVGFLILLGVAIGWFVATRRKTPGPGPSAVQPPEQAQWRQPPPPGGQHQAPLPPPMPYRQQAPLPPSRPAGAYPPLSRPPYAPAPGASAPAYATQRPRRSKAGRWTFIGILLAWLALGLLQLLGVRVAPIAYPATALASAGLALVAASRPTAFPTRRPRGVVAVGLIAALITVSMLLPSGRTAASASSEQLYSSTAELPRTIELGIGSNTIDLSSLTVDADTDLTITQDAGSLTLILPKSSDVQATYNVDLGSLTTPQHSAMNGMDLQASERFGDGSGPTLNINAQLDAGQLRVQR